MQKIIDRYILSELTIAFLLSISVLMSAFLVQQMLRLSRVSAETGIGFFVLIKLAVYIIPLFLVLAIPLSVLISSILTFSRLSTDLEVTAMRSAGISIYRLVPPVLIFSIGAFIIALLSSTILQPMANRHIKLQAYETLKNHKTLRLQEGVFNNLFNLLVYVDKIHGPETIEGILISDRSRDDSKIITAKHGRFLNDPSTASLFLKLDEGHIYFEPKDRSNYQMATFSTYYLRLEAGGSIEKIRFFKEVWGMSLDELKHKLEEKRREGKDREYKRLMIEFHKKFSLPSAALVLGLLGLPIGLISRFSSKFAGFILSILIIFFYYILDAGFEILAVEGMLHPFWAAWMPVTISLILAIYAIIKVSRETGFRLFNKVLWIWYRLIKARR